MDKNEKIYYFRDPKNPKRVMTVVVKFTDTKYGNNFGSMGLSVNRPTEWVTRYHDSDLIRKDLEKGDVFSKARGRSIARGRMEAHPIRISLPQELTSREIKRRVLAYLSMDPNSVVARIAKHGLLDTVKAEEKQKALLSWAANLGAETLNPTELAKAAFPQGYPETVAEEQ